MDDTDDYNRSVFGLNDEYFDFPTIDLYVTDRSEIRIQQN